MDSSEIVLTSKRIWARATRTDIVDRTAWELVRDAVDYVEAIDYPKSNTISGTGQYEFAFATSPTSISQWLYIFKAVEFFEESQEGRQLLDGTIGVDWQRGPDSIKTSNAGQMVEKRLKGIRKKYSSLLKKAKIGEINSTTETLTKNLYQDTDPDFIQVN
jgi:hypothetical protein